MKKTILSVAVAMASMNAFAAQDVADAPVAKHVADQAIENLEVFGKVGVFYDKQDTLDSSEFNYKRHTEVGLQTSTEIGHGLTVSGIAVANFNNPEEQLTLDRMEVGVEHAVGAVHFGKIDDRYDAATTKFDQFNDVFFGDFERHNATGKVEGLALSASPVAGLGLALQAGNGVEGEIGDDIALTATYSIYGVDMAAAYRTTEGEETLGEDAKEVNVKGEMDSYKLGLGYGIGSFYAGFIYEAGEVDGEISGAVSHSGTVDFDTIALSASYKIDALTLKAGYAMDSVENLDSDTIRVAAEYDLDERVALHAGYAKIDGDLAEDDLITAGMIVRF
ncbi:porin [Vibrio coralliirubri]|uniref:porin n=1 Tax=Vibrio coralliirubri TaxID=1516159 RepID=UPI0022851673|nr:porin [Vibrio coralliirubri]MCY9861184.1 porin [Vibrio coralliirubri]